MKTEAELRTAILMLDAEADDESIHPQDRHRAALLWGVRTARPDPDDSEAP